MASFSTFYWPCRTGYGFLTTELAALKMRYEFVLLIVSRLILAACTIAVICQCWQSLNKYLDKPQSTAISIERFANQEVLPSVSICPTMLMTRNVTQHALKDCEM